MTTEILMLIAGVLLAEGTEIAPWLAKRLVRTSARIRYLDQKRAEVRAEEWEAIIESKPGKLFKLATALLFALRAGVAWGSRLPLWMQLFWHTRGDLDRREDARMTQDSLAALVAKVATQEGGTIVITSTLATGIDISPDVIYTAQPPTVYIQAKGRVNRSPTG